MWDTVTESLFLWQWENIGVCNSSPGTRIPHSYQLAVFGTLSRRASMLHTQRMSPHYIPCMGNALKEVKWSENERLLFHCDRSVIGYVCSRNVPDYQGYTFWPFGDTRADVAVSYHILSGLELASGRQPVSAARVKGPGEMWVWMSWMVVVGYKLF
jgi:hypothetical protein